MDSSAIEDTEHDPGRSKWPGLASMEARRNTPKPETPEYEGDPFPVPQPGFTTSRCLFFTGKGASPDAPAQSRGLVGPGESRGSGREPSRAERALERPIPSRAPSASHPKPALRRFYAFLRRTRHDAGLGDRLLGALRPETGPAMPKRARLKPQVRLDDRLRQPARPGEDSKERRLVTLESLARPSLKRRVLLPHAVA
jgi:hypothetical protein